MKILVVPDIHENLDFLKYIMTVEDAASFDHVVFLGDYFDPYDTARRPLERVREIARAIVGYKEALGDRLHLLCGNHDLPYYALRPACEGRPDEVNELIGHWMSVTTSERAEIINSVWDASFWRGLKGALLLDGWLFSHAGVHPSFWPEDESTFEAAYERFCEKWAAALDQIHKEPENSLFTVGWARGGTAPVGGPLWLDWNHEFEDELEVPQIVGHTRCANPNRKGRSYCIDFAQAAYGVVDEGELKLKVWPGSWLAESMEDLE